MVIKDHWHNNNLAKILIRVPCDLRKKLKLLAAYENTSMNAKALNYIYDGLARDAYIVEKLILEIEDA